MEDILKKNDLDDVIRLIQDLYLQDKTPWICGYSGGKDSTAIVQLVWNALKLLPEKDRSYKTIHIISTDTLVESPVIAAWANLSLDRMRKQAEIDGISVIPHRLTPKTTNTYWVNLIGRGYPYPKATFRWCTDRLKIEPSNTFVKKILNSGSEAILVLGTRKAESERRRANMEYYEKKRYYKYLSPNGSLPNSYIFTPLENWSDDNVWQYLMQYENPWGHSNKELLALYSGASTDGECPLVIDTSTPSCGNSRFGCWVCTLVPEDKSMVAMIRNDNDKSWMYPLLDFRNYIKSNIETEVKRRDFRRITGGLTWKKDHLVHGPYKKNVREDFLRKLLEVQKFIQEDEDSPEEVKNIELITIDELQFIRNIWLNDKHEFDDMLPVIYEDVTGQEFPDEIIKQNVYYGREEWNMLEDICKDLYPEETLLLEMQCSLLDIEAKSSMMLKRHNIIQTLEREIHKSAYRDEKDALEQERSRRFRVGLLSNHMEIEPDAEEI